MYLLGEDIHYTAARRVHRQGPDHADPAAGAAGPGPTRHGLSRNPQMRIKENRHVTDLFVRHRVKVKATDVTAMTCDDVIHECEIIEAFVLLANSIKRQSSLLVVCDSSFDWRLVIAVMSLPILVQLMVDI